VNLPKEVRVFVACVNSRFIINSQYKADDVVGDHKNMKNIIWIT
jgi:hypothetical protein